ncbi:hypothetical protein LCGC14_2254450 [marine sediment metagenome]|uniref:Zona occludens toxin N-terminal domain-containing protein n=1 Tax=marine sediment metagenome TaxID=412755 RepID=A0A0F9D1X3_9ZZZZ
MVPGTPSMTPYAFGKDKFNRPHYPKIDPDMADVLDLASKRNHRDFQYIAIIAGIPGAGKTTLSFNLASYVCSWFTLKYVCFTAAEFIRVTTECPQYSAVVLDESFESFNSKGSMTKEFKQILNHLQIIRQKNLFILLNLPNFFDLSKNVAVFLASHLFFVYSTREGDRGRFLVFDRDAKRELYVKGSRYMDYSCVNANFRARFYVNKGMILDESEYESKKLKFFREQNEKIKSQNTISDRNTIIYRLKKEKDWGSKELGLFFRLHPTHIDKIIKNVQKSWDVVED